MTSYQFSLWVRTREEAGKQFTAVMVFREMVFPLLPDSIHRPLFPKSAFQWKVPWIEVSIRMILN